MTNRMEADKSGIFNAFKLALASSNLTRNDDNVVNVSLS